MVNESILGGLRTAVAHKSSLKDAMQSFYNAGYDKNEIKEASQIIFKEQQNKKIEPAKSTEINEDEMQAEQIKKSSSRKLKLIILIIIILLILFGGLIGIVIFKDKIF
jgi:hypothetical protein